jgi:hypothetical protein
MGLSKETLLNISHCSLKRTLSYSRGLWYIRVPLGIEEVNNDIGKGNGQNNNNNIDVIENEKIKSHNKCAVIQELSEASC